MDVSIIIVTYNSAAYIHSCLQSIIRHRTELTYEIIVVDNHSKDATVEWVRAFPQVILIENPQNLGFSAANNLGIKQARGKYIFVLNPDTNMTDHCLDQLVRILEQRKEVGIVGPRLLYSNGTTQESARSFPTLFVQVLGRIPLLNVLVKTQHERYLQVHEDPTLARRVDWVIGAAMLMRKEDLLSVGLFDDGYFLYCEDLDLCYRFTRQGLHVFYAADTFLYHVYQKKSSRKLSKNTLHHLKSLCRFYVKYPQFILGARRRNIDGETKRHRRI